MSAVGCSLFHGCDRSRERRLLEKGKRKQAKQLEGVEQNRGRSRGNYLARQHIGTSSLAFNEFMYYSWNFFPDEL